MSSVKRYQKLLVKIVEHKLEEAFPDGIRRCSTGSLLYPQCPHFSKISQIYLSLLL